MARVQISVDPAGARLAANELGQSARQARDNGEQVQALLLEQLADQLHAAGWQAKRAPGDFAPGDRVRVQLPNWNGPGSLVYIIGCIDGSQAKLVPPRIPGLSSYEPRTYPLDQLVAA